MGDKKKKKKKENKSETFFNNDQLGENSSEGRLSGKLNNDKKN